MTTAKAIANPQLQARAGKNYGSFGGIFNNLNVDSFKLSKSPQTVLEGDGETVAGAFSFGPSVGFLSLFNNTGGTLTFDLFVEFDGLGSILLDSATILNGDADGLTAPSELRLPVGARFYVAANGSVVAGQGVEVLRSTAQLSDAFLSATYKLLTSPTFEVVPPPGVTSPGGVPGVLNFSPTPFTVDVFLVLANGFAFEVGSQGVAANSYATLGGSGVPTGNGVKVHCALTALPTTGPVIAISVFEVLSNSFPVQPPPV